MKTSHILAAIVASSILTLHACTTVTTTKCIETSLRETVIVAKWEYTVWNVEPEEMCNPGGITLAPSRGQRVKLINDTGTVREIVQAVPDRYELRRGQHVFLVADHGRLWVQPVDYPLPLELRTLPAPVSEHESKLHLEVSPGWVATPLSDAMRSDGIIHAAHSVTLDLGTELRAYRRLEVTDLVAFATVQQARLASNLDNPKSSAITPVTLEGRPAIRFEVEGVSHQRNAFEYGYVGTVIQGKDEIAYLLAYTYAASFPSKKDELAHVADAITGL